jgi:uncharacterized protein (TIGR02118 family)
MVKLTVILKRKRGTSHEEFRNYWREVHGPLLLRQPALMRHVRRYVQCHSIADAVAGISSPFDGIAELWGDSVDDVRLGFAEPAYMQVVRPDEEKFLDLPNCIFMVTEEIVMHP